MFSKKKSDALLEMIRNKQQMTGGQKMSLIVLLSVPGILAQMTSVLMFYIDAAMVGHLGANESASIGLVESSTWLFGSITGATSMGFSVQVAHFIGANDFVKARAVFRHSIICTLLLSLCVGVHVHNAVFPIVKSIGRDVKEFWRHAHSECYEHPDVHP